MDPASKDQLQVAYFVLNIVESIERERKSNFKDSVDSEFVFQPFMNVLLKNNHTQLNNGQKVIVRCSEKHPDYCVDEAKNSRFESYPRNVQRSGRAFQRDRHSDYALSHESNTVQTIHQRILSFLFNRQSRPRRLI